MGKKQPCMLPWAGEWRKLVSQVEPDFHVEPDVSRANAEQIVVSGLLRLLLGTSWSVTAPYHWSMDEQWRYWAKPIDAFFANVDKYWSLEEPTAAHFRQRKAGRSMGVSAEFLRQGVRVKVGDGLFHNIHDLLDCAICSAAGSPRCVREILREGGYDGNRQQRVLTICLPEPLVRLLCHGLLPHVMLLARWQGALDLWPAWPDLRWAAAVKGQHLQTQPGPVTAEHIRSLAIDLRRWSSRIIGEQAADAEGPSDEQQLLETHVRRLDAFHESMVPQDSTEHWGKRSRKYAGRLLLSLVFASRSLKSAGSLNKELLKKMVDLLPAGLRDLALEALANENFHLPRWDSRLVLVVDVALMLFRRRTFRAQAARFILADSSPQAGHDWLICKVRCIDASRLKVVFEAISALAHDAKRAADENMAFEDDDEPCLAHERLDRAAMFDILKRALEVSTLPPLALGLGRTTLTDKICTLLFGVFLDHGFEYLEEFLDSIISITTDMGTELGMGDYQCEAATNLLPNYVLDSVMMQDGMDTEGKPLLETSVRFLFNSCLTVVGMLHVFSNASKDVYKCLSCWGTLYTSLKILEKLVTSGDRLRKFVHVCVTPSPHDAGPFSCVAPHLYDKRWGEVFNFCCWLNDSRRLEILRATWDTRLFTEVEVPDYEDAEGSFNPTDIYRVVNDLSIHAAIDLVIGLDRVLQRLSAWCERCPCHDSLQETYKDKVPTYVARAECGAWASTGIPCPVRGCRAPEMAAHQIFKEMEKAFVEVLAALTLAWRDRLSEERWSALVSDFAKGKAHIVYIVTLKLDQWLHLPWFLAILGHHCEEIARDGARVALLMYSTCTAEAANHRLTILLCSENGALGQQMRTFAAGAARESLPDFFAFCCKLAAIPITERSIEQPHGAIKLNTAYKHAGPLCVTASVRFPEAEQHILGDSGALSVLVECVDVAKHLRKIPHHLGIQRHPWLRALPAGRALQSHKLVSVLTSVVYRCDAVAQYQNTAGTHKTYETAKKRRHLEGQQAVGVKNEILSNEKMLARLAT